MRLVRTINSHFDPNQPVIHWDSDVRGIIAAMRARDAANRGRQIRLRLVSHLDLRPVIQTKPLVPMEVAA
jgi:hypothetical protein